MIKQENKKQVQELIIQLQQANIKAQNQQIFYIQLRSLNQFLNKINHD